MITNIIANTCIGADIYKYHLKMPYQTPFCWNTIDDNSMFNLISNYDTINFKKYELIKDKNWNFSILINDLVKVNYVHYHFSKNDNKIRTDNADVYYNKIWEYIIEKYEERTNRFLQLKNKEEPFFVIGSSWNGQKCKLNTIKKISTIDTNYKILFLVDFNNSIELPKNCMLYKHNIIHDNPKLAGEIFNKFLI